jgi:antitoxin ParD1/3/4
MSEFREIKVALTDEQIEAIKTAVAAGEYAGEYTDTSEVVRQVIGDWLDKREAPQRDIAKLRQLWEEGLASGPPRPWDFDELRFEARLRVKATKKASGDDR